MDYEQWKLEHEIYLKTDKWQLIRDKVLARDHETCQKCKKVGWVVHHLTYARWRNERLADLMTVCDECHKLIHLEKKAAQNNKKVDKDHRIPKSNKPLEHSCSKNIKNYIEKISKFKEFVRMDKAARKLLYPHPIEILNHFGFSGSTYQEKFNDIMVKWFRKEDLIRKLQTMKSVMNSYRNRGKSQ